MIGQLLKRRDLHQVVILLQQGVVLLQHQILASPHFWYPLLWTWRYRAAKWLRDTHCVLVKASGLSLKIIEGKDSFWFLFCLHLWLTMISKNNWPKCTGAPVPMSYNRVAKSLETVGTCLVGSQLLRAILRRPLYLRVKSSTFNTLHLGHTHL